MRRKFPCSRSGFTLVEVLIALAIASIGLLAAVRATGQATASVVELRSRIFAGWVAENILADYRVQQTWPSLGIQRGVTSQAATELFWRTEVIATPHQAFRRVDVYVFVNPDGNHDLAHFTGFLIRPGGVRE